MDTNRLLLNMTSAGEETREEARYELGLRMDDAIARSILDIASSDAAVDVRGDAIIAFGPVIEISGIDYDDDEDALDYDESGNPVSRETFDAIVREIGELYSDETQPKLVRRRALEVLIRDPQPWHAHAVRKHFASPDPEWKRTAVFAMGMISGFDRELVKVVETEDGDLLYEAVRAAGNMEVTGVAHRIRDLAADDDTEPALRFAAIAALPHVDADAADVLSELVESDDEDIAEAAEEALDELTFARRLGDLDNEE